MANIVHGVIGQVLRRIPLIRPVGVIFAGGSYRDAPAMPLNWFGVSMARELPPKGERHRDAHVPCEDFQVPDSAALADALRRALREAIVESRPVYVGCMGGTGRTGIFMACLCAILTPEEDPVTEARRRYKERAVETRAQENFVVAFAGSEDAEAIRKEVNRMVFWRQLGRWIARRKFPA